MKKTIAFLKQLETNNDRDWFAENKSIYQESLNEFKAVFSDIETLMKSHDIIDTAKVFRIYRDVRFSKNKLPYKTHFSGSFGRKKPELRGGYYVHIQPNNKSFIATGFWDPNKEDLLRIRREFEMDDDEIRDIMSNKLFKSVWGTMEGDELKTAPRDFDKEHKAIDLIRKKQFIFTKKYTDKEILSSGFINSVNENFKTIKPFFNYMSDVLTTNLNGESLI
ncbi:DUF2461 domain-containing protein [Aurantibacter sp.]|uniref:DUF2461 domain-containing protein n=1 Tax=Aurantibacter sp. TaxID=2807103 RepID=UPI0035C86988